MTFLQLAEKVIREEGRPLTPSEIWDIGKKYKNTKGKTPVGTISAALHRDIEDNPKTTVFVKRDSKFSLKEFLEEEIENEPKDNIVGRDTDYSHTNQEKGKFSNTRVIIKIIVNREGNITISKAEISNKNILLFKFPRSAFQKIEEINKPGVYVLVGKNDDEIYIGQSDDVQRRLSIHHSSKENEFWVETMVFLSKDDTLNRASVKYLESRLLGIAREENNVKIKNDQDSQPPHIGEMHKIEVDDYLNDLLLLTKELGIKFFEKRYKTPVKQAHAKENPSIESTCDDNNKFSFDKLNIKPGTTLVFMKDENEECTVKSNKIILYKNKEYSLTGLTKILMRKRGSKRDTFQGSMYFKVKGEKETLKEKFHLLST